ncbi:hypothetical protein GCM10020295_00090 [Streptomyces cinereospinus]
MLLVLGWAKSRESMAGMSTPSAQQRQLVRTARRGGCCEAGGVEGRGGEVGVILVAFEGTLPGADGADLQGRVVGRGHQGRGLVECFGEDVRRSDAGVEGQRAAQVIAVLRDQQGHLSGCGTQGFAGPGVRGKPVQEAPQVFVSDHDAGDAVVGEEPSSIASLREMR